MSLYGVLGRNKLAKWLINCIYIDLVICGILLVVNLSGTFEYIREQLLGAAIVVALFLFYIALIYSSRDKLLEFRDSTWRKISEIFATFYLFIHVTFYIFIIGAFLSGIYLGLSRIQVSSDFLLSWAIIISALSSGVFYLRNKEYRPLSEPDRIHTDPRWDYPDGHLSEEEQDSNENKLDIPSRKETEDVKNPVYLNCYICGKRDLLPLKGKDGRYYCRDHILPENREIEPDLENNVTNLDSEDLVLCFGCGHLVHLEEVTQCGPCFEQDGRKKLFCQKCWNIHQWSHGKSPAMGICYSSNGTFSGYDGSEEIKRG
jgi:hypothetical protein